MLPNCTCIFAWGYHKREPYYYLVSGPKTIWEVSHLGSHFVLNREVHKKKSVLIGKSCFNSKPLPAGQIESEGGGIMEIVKG